MSPEFLRQHGDTTPYPQAPELCVEILSPSNSPAEIEGKIRLDLGYDEGWISLFGPEGHRRTSALPGISGALAI